MTAVEVEFKHYPKQKLLIHSPATEVLWGGAAGPGKSHGSRLALIAWATSIDGLQCYLFRREYGDLVRNHMEGPTGFRAMLQPLVDAKRCIIREKDIEFWNGSKIFLSHCQHEKDVFGYQGAEMHVLIIEEATQFTEFQIRYLRTRVRMPDTVRVPEVFKGRFPRIVYPTNPGGVGHSYLKKAFWEPAQKLPAHATWKAPEDDGGFVRQFIPAKLTDNPSVNPEEYAKRLKGIGSPEYVRALLEGDWSVIVGAFFSELSETRHRIPDLYVPHHWLRFAWYDWGFGQPACCLFFAVSDGEAAETLAGDEIILPRGALVVYREVYLCSAENPAIGARMTNAQQAEAILRAAGRDKIAAYFSDSKPFQSTGQISESPAKEFLNAGIVLKQGDTSNRVAAWSMVHSRLQANPPMLYFCESAKHTWRTMGALQTNPTKPEDADSDGDDHAPDCVKGGCTVRKAVHDADRPIMAQIQREATAKPTINKVLRGAGRGWY